MISEPVPGFSLYAAWAAAVLPLMAFGVILVFLRKRPKLSAALSIGAISVSLACALYLLARHWHTAAPMEWTAQWMVSGNLSVPVGVLLDPLSLLMLVIVATISFLVQVYSLGYMAGERGFDRFYAFMSLFAWAMISLVLAPNVLQVFIFWELVGLASYLLIGFWYEKESASRAGRKAFVMTRLGDTFFFMGWLILLVWGGTLNIIDLNNGNHNLTASLVTVSSLLVFGGIVGKSAQFPLLTWLPDAMEGPTPVSALLHSATMVAAGVYLLGRLYPYFSQSDVFLTVCLAVGAISMLLSATMAMVARDVKQVWAYSTVSQLGLMIMALGAGDYFAGMFHLTTHAGFKSLLFLCAGVLMHVFETNDMFVIGRSGGRTLRLTMACMVAGALALSGIFPFSGFFSKEAIMAALAALDNPSWWIVGLVGVFLTAYYTFRLIFVILLPKTMAPPEQTAGHAPHHAGPEMAFPLVVLTAITLVLGFFGGAIGGFLERATGHAEAHAFGFAEFVSLVLALTGILVAWWEFGRKAAGRIGFAERSVAVRRLFAERWYLDRFIRWMVDRFLDRGIAEASHRNDMHVVDGIVHAIGNGVIYFGRVAAGWHQAMIQSKLMVIFAVIFGLMLIMLVSG